MRDRRIQVTEEKKRKSLGTKMLWGIVAFALILVIAICVPVCMGIYSMRIDDYSNAAFSYTRSAADYINGDTIAKYVETGEKDEYYNEVLEYLNSCQKESDIKYYYVFVPYENDLVYVWDAVYEEGHCELGEHEEYMEGGKEAVDAVMKLDPPEDILITDDDKYGHIASAYSPIFDSSGKAVAVVGVDLSFPDMKAMIRQIILSIVAITSVVSFFMVAITYVILDRNIVRPIGLLTEKAGEMISKLETDKEISVDIDTNDEIETLAESFVTMDRDLREYIRKLGTVTAERERIGAELNIATKIQASMLPRIFPPFPDKEEFELFASMSPAKEVGGDFYDFFMVGEDKLALIIADVSGKGVPAALFMVIAKVLIKNFTLQGMPTSEVLSTVNERLCANNDTGLFVTVWIAIIDLKTGDGRASNAGHEHPALYRQKEGSFELVKYRHSPAVAAMEGMKFEEHGFHLDPGDMLFVYTDGVTEASNADNELFGEERLTAALNSCSEKQPAAILTGVKASIDEFVGDADQFDDITMLSMKYEGPKKA